MLGVLLQFTLQMILQAVAGNSEMQAQLAGTIPLNKADIDKIVEKLDVMSFILTTVCCMVCFKLFMEIEKLADKVSSSTSVGKLGKKAGAITAQVVKMPISKIRKRGGKFVKASANRPGRKLKTVSTEWLFAKPGAAPNSLLKTGRLKVDWENCNAQYKKHLRNSPEMLKKLFPSHSFIPFCLR